MTVQEASLKTEEEQWRDCVIADFKAQDRRIMQLEIAFILPWALVLILLLWRLA